MEGTGKRQMSNGGGQSSLGYLFGAAAEQEQAAASVQPVMAEPLREHDVNAHAAVNAGGVNMDNVSKMILKDLRSELRAQGLSPAGGKETLIERLTEHLQNSGGPLKSEMGISKAMGAAEMQRRPSNNYHRPEGQNVGNFLTDRNSSKVLAPPGGKSSFSLG